LKAGTRHRAEKPPKWGGFDQPIRGFGITGSRRRPRHRRRKGDKWDIPAHSTGRKWKFVYDSYLYVQIVLIKIFLYGAGVQNIPLIPLMANVPDRKTLSLCVDELHQQTIDFLGLLLLNPMSRTIDEMRAAPLSTSRGLHPERSWEAYSLIFVLTTLQGASVLICADVGSGGRAMNI
jgi:hypothetical protein